MATKDQQPTWSFFSDGRTFPSDIMTGNHIAIPSSWPSTTWSRASFKATAKSVDRVKSIENQIHMYVGCKSSTGGSLLQSHLIGGSSKKLPPEFSGKVPRLAEFSMGGGRQTEIQGLSWKALKTDTLHAHSIDVTPLKATHIFSSSSSTSYNDTYSPTSTLTGFIQKVEEASESEEVSPGGCLSSLCVVERVCWLNCDDQVVRASQSDSNP